MRKVIICVLILVLFIISFLVLGSIAISDTSAIDNVDIELENVKIQNLKLQSCELKLTIKISNPNSNTISDLIAEFDIFISNTDVGDGVVTKVSIPPKSYEKSDVFIIIYYADVGHAVINGLESGNFELRISGEARINIFFNLIPINKLFSTSYSYNQ